MSKRGLEYDPALLKAEGVVRAIRRDEVWGMYAKCAVHCLGG